MSDLTETAELVAFATVVDEKSFSKAAAQLKVPRATIGRRLVRLEERLGVRLLRRTTRSLVLTDAGESFYRHARIVLDALRQAETSVQRSDDEARGDLRISVPPMLNDRFYSMICAFRERHPLVKLHVHFASHMVDLQRGGYDVAIRASADLEHGLVARTLARMPLYAVASPRYLEEKGTPRTVRDLRKHDCLMGFARGETPQTHWPMKSGGKIYVEGSFFSNEITLLLAASLRGLGVALLPYLIVEPFLRRGDLRHVLPGIIEAESRLAVVYTEREFVPAAQRLFVEEVVKWAKTELVIAPPDFCQEVVKGERSPRPRNILKLAKRIEKK